MNDLAFRGVEFHFPFMTPALSRSFWRISDWEDVGMVR